MVSRFTRLRFKTRWKGPHNTVHALAIGHVLVSGRRNKVVRDFGEALEEA